MPFLSLDPINKVSETETHVFFLKGPFSQWHPSVFEAELEEDGDYIEFNCAEQYMMASKAVLFGDMDTLSKIMAVQQERDSREAPKKQKALGRAVKGFDPAKWDQHARDIVYRGNLAKFILNPDMEKTLLATGKKTLVEGAHYDPVWGVALAWDDPTIIDPANWKGTNWLGQTLTELRNDLQEVYAQSKQNGFAEFPNPWKRALLRALHA